MISENPIAPKRRFKNGVFAALDICAEKRAQESGVNPSASGSSGQRYVVERAAAARIRFQIRTSKLLATKNPPHDQQLAGARRPCRAARPQLGKILTSKLMQTENLLQDQLIAELRGLAALLGRNSEEF